MARRCYGRGNVISHDDFLDDETPDLETIPFVSGHFGFDVVAPLLVDRFSFTFLRNPEDRLISLYDFCRRKAPDTPLQEAAQGRTIEQFLLLAQRDSGAHPSVREAIWNNQVWQLASGRSKDSESRNAKASTNDLSNEALLERAIQNASKLNYVGFQETFDVDVDEIFKTLVGFWRPRVRRDNVTPNKLRTAKLSDACKQILQEMTELDTRLYDHFWSRRGRAH